MTDPTIGEVAKEEQQKLAAAVHQHDKQRPEGYRPSPLTRRHEGAAAAEEEDSDESAGSVASDARSGGGGSATSRREAEAGSRRKSTAVGEDQSLQELRGIFAAFDENRDGFLTKRCAACCAGAGAGAGADAVAGNCGMRCWRWA